MRQIPISQKIIILVLTISIIPIIVVGILGYRQSEKTITRISLDAIATLLDTARQNIELSFQDYMYLSDELMFTDIVSDTLKNFENMTPTEKFDATEKIKQEITSKFTRISHIHDIRIVNTKNIPVYSSGYLFLEDDFSKDNFEKIKDHSSSTFWYITSYNTDTYFVLSRKIFDSISNEPIGYIFIHIKPDGLDQIFEKISPNISLILLDSSGTTFYSSDKGGYVKNDIITDIYRETDTTDIIWYEKDNSHLINYTSLPVSGWKMITILPYSYVTDSIHNIARNVLLIVAISVVFCLLVSHFIWKGISEPLTKMLTLVKEIPNLDLRLYPAEKHLNELDYLTDAHQQILTKMKTMAEQIKHVEREKRKAEIKMLQAQINPHFLFNTLDSLRFTALMSNVPTLSDGLSALSRILRNSIIKEDSYISIMDEVKNIQDYLTIQKIRYGETIDFITDVPENCKHYRIMKFLLQPIVENSVIHGLSEELTICIHLSVRTEKDFVYITLKDNGKGFDVSQIYDSQNDTFKSSKLSGIGLNNVKQRLSLEYGKKQQFIIYSEEGTGTTISVIFPKIERKNNSNV